MNYLFAFAFAALVWFAACGSKLALALVLVTGGSATFVALQSPAAALLVMLASSLVGSAFPGSLVSLAFVAGQLGALTYLATWLGRRAGLSGQAATMLGVMLVALLLVAAARVAAWQ